jgi:hypothetical protein
MIGVKPFLIEHFAKLVIPSKAWEALVFAVEKQNATNSKESHVKRADALYWFKKSHFVLKEWQINLGLELAVAWLKAKPE